MTKKSPGFGSCGKVNPLTNSLQGGKDRYLFLPLVRASGRGGGLGKHQPARRGLERAGDAHLHRLANLAAAILHNHHRAIIEVADTLIRLFPDQMKNLSRIHYMMCGEYQNVKNK